MGFEASLSTPPSLLAAVAALMPAGLPRGRRGAKFAEVFLKDRNINRLAAARLFLFGARDVSFIVGIPIYFFAILSDGTADGRRAAFFLVGSFMALWIIGYGAVQAAAPRLLGAERPAARDDRARAVLGRAARPSFLRRRAARRDRRRRRAAALADAFVVAGLMAFGVVFALNSALHSYLILAFSRADRVTMDVGFYYMANAAGRLLGTLLSGLSSRPAACRSASPPPAAMAGASRLWARRLA